MRVDRISLCVWKANRSHFNVGHYFVSHKKTHSVHGPSSEVLARGSKDLLEAVHGLRGFFDASTFMRHSSFLIFRSSTG